MDNPDPGSGCVAQTWIASWWPGKRYVVSTFQCDTSSPTAKLTYALEHKVSFENVPFLITGYSTVVSREDRIASGKHLYMREYSTLAEAQDGHKDIVKLLAAGKLKLKPWTTPGCE
jgi:hypothetical protein